jgi:hypothetical protein
MTIEQLASIGTFLAAAGGFVAAVGAFVVANRNREKAEAAKVAAEVAAGVARDLKREVVSIGGEVFELGKRVDGRLSELLEASIAKALAEGIQQERDRDKP